MIRLPVTVFSVLLGCSALAQAEWGVWAGPRWASVDMRSDGSRRNHTAGSPALGGDAGIWFQSKPSSRGGLALRTGLGFSALHVSFRNSISRDVWTKTTDLRCIELPIVMRHGVGKRVQGSLGLHFAVPVFYADVVEGVRSGFQQPNNFIVNQHYRIALRSTYMVSRLIVGLSFGLSCRIGERYGVDFFAVLPMNRTERYVYDGASFEYAQGYSTTRSRYTHLSLRCTYAFGQRNPTAPAGAPSVP